MIAIDNHASTPTSERMWYQTGVNCHTTAMDIPTFQNDLHATGKTPNQDELTQFFNGYQDSQQLDKDADTLMDDPRAFLRRFFEPTPYDWHTRFKVGDRVRLARPDLFGLIPSGAEGVITRIEEPGSYMADKGRVYEVLFDMRPFNIRLRDRLPAAQSAKHGVDPDEPLLNTTINVAPHDIEPIDG